MTTMPTCGELFRSFEEECGSWPCLQPANIPYGNVRLADRAVGHMRGQAEKVYLGACQAFMIRPAEDWWGWSIEVMALVCLHYDLRLYLPDGEHGEVWGCKDVDTIAQLDMMFRHVPVNSQLWHVIRAQLCGVKKVDILYHTRAGYGQRCEPEDVPHG